MTSMTRPAGAAPRAGVNPPAADLAGAFLRLVLFIALPMGAIIYSTAWFWPQNAYDYAVSEAPGQKEFRIIFWCVVVILIAAVALRSSLHVATNAFAPYAAFFGISILSTVFSDDPATVAWFLAQWFVMACAGIGIGMLSSPRRLESAATCLFIAIPLISLILLPIHPAWVTMPFQGKTLLRGLFVHKNATGAFSGTAALFLVAFRADIPRPWLRWCGIVLCVLILVLSESMTSIGEFAIGLAALLIIGRVRAVKATLGAKVGLMFFGIALIVLLVNLALPVVISTMNKSLSLNNRVVGWGLYWHFFQDHLMLGRGPGAFVTSTSNFNKIIETMIPNDKNGSVHNAYLAILGEVGMIGLIFYVLGLLYIGIVAPFRRQANTADIAAAALTAAILAGSFTEARETLTPGLTTFLVMVCRGAAVASRVAQRRAQSVGRRNSAVNPATQTGSLNSTTQAAR